MSDDFEGFLELNKVLDNLVSLVETNKILDEEELIAKEFVDDLMRIARPRSRISKAGYTHLIDTFAYRRTDKDVAVGWGKYYGPMVERGAKQMKNGGTPHLVPLWNRNANKYIENFKKRNNLT